MSIDAIIASVGILVVVLVGHAADRELVKLVIGFVPIGVFALENPKMLTISNVPFLIKRVTIFLKVTYGGQYMYLHLGMPQMNCKCGG